MAEARLTLLQPAQSLAVVRQSGQPGVLVLGPAVPASGAVLLSLAGALRGEKGDAGSALESYTAAQALSGHVAVTLDAAGQAIPADCRTPAHAAALRGVTVGAASAGALVTVRGAGLLESPGWGLTPGQPVYLGIGGALVQAVPSTAAFTRPLGRALSATAVLLDLQPAIFLST